MIRFGQEIQNFAENTTAHGFRYIGQRGASLVSRLFWIFVIGSGFSLVGYLAHQSFADWSSSPVITTIDSVSASIKDLPFPTVTICPKLDTNQFAYPEMVANEHKFNVKLEEAQEIWKDFGFMKEKILQNIESHLARLDAEGISWPHIDEEFKFRNSVITWLFRNQTTPEKLYQEMRQSLGHDINFKTYVRQLGKIYGKFKNLPAVQTHVEERRLNQSMGEADLFYKKGYLICGQNGFLEFGQLLSKFSHLFGQSFQREEHHEKIYKAQSCSLLTPDEIKIHDYYASLAKVLGFNNISLYELPRLAHPPPADQKGLSTFRDNTPYTSCNQTRSNMRLHSTITCSQSMFTNAKRRSEQPCIGKGSKAACCSAGQALGGLDNLENLMRVMRYARHLSPSQDNFTRFFEPFFKPDVEKQLKYPFHHFQSGYFKNGRLALNPHSAIPVCRFDDGQTFSSNEQTRTARECELIQPVITDRGMCMAFNSDSLTTLFNNNEYLQIMKKVFATEFERDLPIVKSITAGDHVGFTAFLDQRTYLQPDFRYSSNMGYGSFIVGFNPSWKSFNMRSKITRLRIGYETEVLITPFELRASERLRDLSFAQRRCRFPDELTPDMTFFKRYSQDGCQFECLLKAATSICLCTPWDYPFLVPELRDTCSFYGALCFNEILKNVTENAKCSCLADCSDVQYRFTEKEWPVDVAAL
ncbi:hypothetical protein TCAL_01937 [Tigriopus californicus]|uniref:Uncharacterized protein n=2 Tax=Tigriopus californicus TaxID=6832 RepID=A0A553P6G5_TIGCA|nr:hypothetical protein TCAL_01937 [Tigriopus californicus]